MNARIERAVSELRDATDAGAVPADALKRLRAALGPGVEVVGDRVHGDHYELTAIIDTDDGALVIRDCRDRGDPLATVGADRMADRVLLRVDDEHLPVTQAIELLDFVWAERPLMTRLVDVCLIQAALRAEPVTTSDNDVQAALDELRLANGLATAEATAAWLAARGLDHAALEARAEDLAAVRALRARAIGHEIEPWFAAHRDDYTAADVLWFALDHDVAAQARWRRAAAEHLALDACLRGALTTGRRGPAGQPLVAHVRRGSLPPPLAAAVFAAAPAALRVVHDGDACTAVYPIAVAPPVLDAATREAIAEERFAAWLAARRARARVTWNWGPPER